MFAMCRLFLVVLVCLVALLTCSNADAGIFFPRRGSPAAAFNRGINAGARDQAFRQGFNVGRGQQFRGDPRFFIGNGGCPHPSQFQLVPVPQSFGFFAF